MILPTMTEEERLYEVFRQTRWLYDWLCELGGDITDKFKRTIRYPYIQRYSRTDNRGNQWRMVVILPNKTMKKRRKYFIMCYVVYENPPRHKEKYDNAGKGVMMLSPMAMMEYINTKYESHTKMAAIMDIIPHAFHRYTQRCLAKEGKGDYDIHKKLECLLMSYMHFDVTPSEDDKNANKHQDDGWLPYDVMTKDGGILRGHLMNGVLIRFFTYIGADDLYDSQEERYEEMKKEALQWKVQGKYI